MEYIGIASAAFGLEGLVAKELKHLGIDAKGEEGGARFKAELSDFFRVNLHLRMADRVYLILSESTAMTFNMIFEQVENIPWETFMNYNANIVVKAKCVRSQIMSPRDCQSIAKKAIIKRLQKVYKVQQLPENGVPFVVDVSIHNNTLRVSLDTSGDALNKRGYRIWNASAPIRETLAAAILEISPWKLKMPLYDPCCGSATILIEGAFRALKRASGLTRSFAIEKWGILNEEEMRTIRKTAQEDFDKKREIHIAGSDIDEEVLELAKRHIQQAGLNGLIKLNHQDVRKLCLEEEGGCFVVNPPYGERLQDKKEAQKLYRDLGRLLLRHPTWSMAVISSDSQFEKFFGKRADKKRRVYNGRLECNVYMYYAEQ